MSDNDDLFDTILSIFGQPEPDTADVIRFPRNTEVLPEDLQYLRFNPVTTAKIKEEISKISTMTRLLDEYGTAYRLRLTLVDGPEEGKSDGLTLSPEDRDVLKNYGRARKGISRVILMRGDLQLRTLHFIIQRAFGWRNIHPHHFSLSQEDFDTITAGRLGGYTDLCGTLFRFPDDDAGDLNWDQRYNDRSTVKNWLRSKYRHPYDDCSIGDCWIANQWAVEDLHAQFPQFTDATPIEAVEGNIGKKSRFNHLSEHSFIRELFTMTPGESNQRTLRQWKAIVVGMNELMDDIRASIINEHDTRYCFRQIRGARSALFSLIDYKALYGEDYEQDMADPYLLGSRFYDTIKGNRTLIRACENLCREMFCDYNLQVPPYFDTLYYHYSDKEGWCVKVTLEEIYTCQQKEANEILDYKKLHDMDINEDDAAELMNYVSVRDFSKDQKLMFRDSRNKRVDEELDNMLNDVTVYNHPACIAADGLPVMDDCGGIEGYLNILRVIHGPDKEAAAEMKQRAKEKGWNGLRQKAQYIL